MDCRDLSTEQLDQLKEQMGRSHRYFRVLKERMEKQRFSYNDELRRKVTRVCDALHSLWVSLHYLSCKGGCGQSRTKAQGKPVRVYRVQTVMDPGAPVSPQYIQEVEAETPLEAVFVLARQGYLTGDEFFVRIFLEGKTLVIPLSHDAVNPLLE